MSHEAQEADANLAEIARLQSALDDARKATAEFNRMRLLACKEVERLAPLAQQSYALQSDLIFLRAECDGAKEREATLRARILEWEDAYDRLEGAFDLHMAISECRSALSDYAGGYYDVVLGELAEQAERAEASRKAWTEIGAKAQADSAALLAELDAARAVMRALDDLEPINWPPLLDARTAYDAATKGAA